MTRTPRNIGLPAALALALAGVAFLTPRAASADASDPEQAALASEMQMAAIEAMTAGDWTAAEERARAALSLDGGVQTAQARLVLALALEQRGDLRDARAELDTLLAMELLPQHRQKAEELKERLAASGPPAPSAPDGLTPEAQKILGIGLVAGGAVPLALGVTFIGFDAQFASQGIESGGWAILGTSLLGTGIALEIVGVHLLIDGRKPTSGVAGTALRWIPTVGVSFEGPEAPTLRFGVVGQW